MNNLYEALENCLQDIEQGADIESVLFRYPDLAEELRPILEASAGAKSMAAAAPSADVVRRNRARVLGQAAQMRESKVKSSQRMWFVSLRRIAVALAVVTVLFVSGTGLVGASSDTLPGDNLYPVKRTWEGVRLLLTFNAQAREALEVAHENERLHELWELFKEGRSAEVDFKGRVTSQNGNEWVVAGVRVLIDNQTEIRDQQGIGVGSAVRVRGITREDGTVRAERIRLLDSDAKLPDADDDNENNSGSVTGDKKPRSKETETPEPENSNSGNENDSDEDDDDHNDDDDNSNNDRNNSNDNNDDNSGSDDNGNDNDDDDSNSNDDDDDSGGGDNGSSDDDNDDEDDDD